MAVVAIRIAPEPFDTTAELARIKQVPGVGAVVTFSGVCRNEGGRLAALEIEHYPGMAEAEIAKIAEDATSCWPVSAITVIHRIGVIPVGDDIVLVAAGAPHREAAFAAAEFLMDYLKTRAPFWKKEHAIAGGEHAWVGSRESDAARALRWKSGSPKA